MNAGLSFVGFIGVFLAALGSLAITSHQLPNEVPPPSISEQAPPQGWTTQAELIRVMDGDTIEVEVKRTVKIRLLDCWAPEKHEAAGPASTANLKQMIEGKKLLIHVPVQSAEVEDIWTFGRVLGTVWLSDRRSESVNAAQVRQGFATKEKQ